MINYQTYRFLLLFVHLLINYLFNNQNGQYSLYLPNEKGECECAARLRPLPGFKPRIGKESIYVHIHVKRKRDDYRGKK